MTTATRTAKKLIGIISTKTALHVQHTFLYISLPFLHDHNVKLPSYVFCRGNVVYVPACLFSLRLIFTLV